MTIQQQKSTRSFPHLTSPCHVCVYSRQVLVPSCCSKLFPYGITPRSSVPGLTNVEAKQTLVHLMTARIILITIFFNIKTRYGIDRRNCGFINRIPIILGRRTITDAKWGSPRSGSHSRFRRVELLRLLIVINDRVIGRVISRQ